MELKTKYSMGQMVFLRTDKEQAKRLVTAIQVRENGYTYELTKGDFPPTWHTELEISAEEDVLLKIS